MLVCDSPGVSVCVWTPLGSFWLAEVASALSAIMWN